MKLFISGLLIISMMCFSVSLCIFFKLFIIFQETENTEIDFGNFNTDTIDFDTVNLDTSEEIDWGNLGTVPTNIEVCCKTNVN